MLGAALAFLPGRSACEASKALLDARCSMLDARCCDAGERQPTVGAEHGPPLLRREIEADPRFGGLNGSMSVRARGQPPTQQTRARVKTRCHPLPMKLGQHFICAHLLGSPKMIQFVAGDGAAIGGADESRLAGGLQQRKDPHAGQEADVPTFWLHLGNVGGDLRAGGKKYGLCVARPPGFCALFNLASERRTSEAVGHGGGPTRTELGCCPTSAAKHTIPMHVVLRLASLEFMHGSRLACRTRSGVRARANPDKMQLPEGRQIRPKLVGLPTPQLSGGGGQSRNRTHAAAPTAKSIARATEPIRRAQRSEPHLDIRACSLVTVSFLQAIKKSKRSHARTHALSHTHSDPITTRGIVHIGDDEDPP
ncbi:hypothetical protein PaG_04704 [Moesziomyces aphidis]|uniref:Uncharacterized protein n=1 Tax=Moesziomyces aphidis TaxID=84754 RepID=W3VJ24_MOEAP|nr:hypothetical protein PaG_04704 [Moesziomyces aphidis]